MARPPPGMPRGPRRNRGRSSSSAIAEATKRPNTCASFFTSPVVTMSRAHQAAKTAQLARAVRDAEWSRCMVGLRRACLADECEPRVTKSAALRPPTLSASAPGRYFLIGILEDWVAYGSDSWQRCRRSVPRHNEQPNRLFPTMCRFDPVLMRETTQVHEVARPVGDAGTVLDLTRWPIAWRRE